MRWFIGTALMVALILSLASPGARSNPPQHGSHKSQNQQGSKQGKPSVDLKKGQQNSTLPPKNSQPVGSQSGKHMQFDRINNVGKNPNIGDGARDAIGTLVSGNFLSSDQRQDLNNLLTGNPANLKEDDLKAVQEALNYDAVAKKEEQYLKIENASGERLTVWVHYETLGEKNEFAWFPSQPVNEEKALRLELEPGSVTHVKENKVQVAARRARIWAESASGRKWLTYRDQDLVLKPKSDGREADKMGTYPLRFVSNDITKR
jgi:hypothetical protein